MIYRNQLRKISVAVSMLLGACSLTFGFESSRQHRDTHSMSNEELVVSLESTEKEQAHQAILEIIKRGDVMLPGLLRCKGNRKFFYGYGLGHRDSAFLMLLPTGNKEKDEARAITVEVAALYLVSAIYYETLEFAQAPYLTDGTPVKLQRFNTRDRVAKAWLSVDKWRERLESEGLESLRKKKEAPLKEPGVHFWGTSG